jgi:hypothetical protein
MAIPKSEYPRTMAKGVFKGRVFETQADYLKAISEHSKKFGPTRRVGKGRKSVAVVASNNGHSQTRAIIDAYDLLREQGIGKAAAVQLIDLLVKK